MRGRLVAAVALVGLGVVLGRIVVRMWDIDDALADHGRRLGDVEDLIASRVPRQTGLT